MWSNLVNATGNALQEVWDTMYGKEGNKMGKFRFMLMGTAAVGLTAVAVAPAFADEVEKSVTLAGQVSRVLAIVDDGTNTQIYGVDNDHSSSRLMFTGEAASKTLTATAYVEFDVVGNEHADQDTGNSTTLGMRHSYVSLKNGLGELTIGYTDTAAADAATLSFSEAAGDGSTFADPVFGGVQFIASTSTASYEENAAVLSGVTPGDKLDDYSSGRANTVKYTSPDLSGFTVLVSADSDSADGVGSQLGGQVRYSADYDGTKVMAAVAGASTGASSTTYAHTLSGGVAVKLANGLNAMVGGGTKEAKAAGRNDPEGWTAQIGYDASMVDAGETSFMVMYESNEDKDANGEDYESVAVNISQSLSDYGTTVYAGVQNFEYKTATTNYRDITAGWVGVRVAF